MPQCDYSTLPHSEIKVHCTWDTHDYPIATHQWLSINRIGGVNPGHNNLGSYEHQDCPQSVKPWLILPIQMCTTDMTIRHLLKWTLTRIKIFGALKIRPLGQGKKCMEGNWARRIGETLVDPADPNMHDQYDY